jgi:isopentenyl diphosphate isomerase/L-lactate dehydrogenase-like FMN-dependent dehydrogenase
LIEAESSDDIAHSGLADLIDRIGDVLNHDHCFFWIGNMIVSDRRDVDRDVILRDDFLRGDLHRNGAQGYARWRLGNIGDFRSMARRRLPGPIFHYIDGAADDEVTYRRNTDAYERCDLVPNVLAGVESIDMSITVMGQKIGMPLFCAPTALQRLFHHDGERAVAKAAEKFGAMFGISSLGTISIEEISTISTPKLFQLYFHKDRGLTNSMIERCIAANFDVLALTVDTITGGNRERDLRTGFTSPPRLTLKSLLSFAMHPRWAANRKCRQNLWWWKRDMVKKPDFVAVLAIPKCLGQRQQVIIMNPDNVVGLQNLVQFRREALVNAHIAAEIAAREFRKI